MPVTIPPLPELPKPGATQEQIDDFHRQLALANTSIALAEYEHRVKAQPTRDAHAKAQADTATAMQAHATSNYVIANAFALPAAELPVAAEKRSKAIELLTQMPVSVGDTDASRVKSANAQVELVFAAYPRMAVVAPTLFPQPAAPVPAPTPAPTPGPAGPAVPGSGSAAG